MSFSADVQHPRSVVHGGFVITASELGPYPFTIDLIPPADYRLTLVIDEE